MTAKESLNLIDWLKGQGSSNEKIIECLKSVDGKKQESSRLILGLRERGWTDTEITDFILWIETGDEQYKPKATTEKK